MANKDYYKILGVEKNANKEDIKKHLESLHTNIILIKEEMLKNSKK